MFDFKHADKKALKAEYDRIAKETGDDQFFTKKELNYLPELLLEGEQVLTFSSGIMDNNTWLIALTDKRIIFINKGLIFGVKHAIINLDKINGIEGSTGLLFGQITINDGAVVRKITNVWKKTVKYFVSKTLEAIDNLNKQKNEPAPAQTQAVDVATQLEKLAALKEKGILTEEEFAAQKAKLLGL